MKNESIELQLMSEGKGSSAPVRQMFRIPVTKEDFVQVLIKQKKSTNIDGLKESVKLELKNFAPKANIDINNSILDPLIDHIGLDNKPDNIDINIIYEAWTFLMELHVQNDAQ